MGGFILGAGCAVLIAILAYAGLTEFGVSTAERVAQGSVKIERGLDYDSEMHDQGH